MSETEVFRFNSLRRPLEEINLDCVASIVSLTDPRCHLHTRATDKDKTYMLRKILHNSGDKYGSLIASASLNALSDTDRRRTRQSIGEFAGGCPP